MNLGNSGTVIPATGFSTRHRTVLRYGAPTAGLEAFALVVIMKSRVGTPHVDPDPLGAVFRATSQSGPVDQLGPEPQAAYFRGVIRRWMNTARSAQVGRTCRFRPDIFIFRRV